MVRFGWTVELVFVDSQLVISRYVAINFFKGTTRKSYWLIFQVKDIIPVCEDEYVRDGLCADEAERRDVHDGGVHGEVHGQAVGQVRRPVDRLHREEHPDVHHLMVVETASGGYTLKLQSFAKLTYTGCENLAGKFEQKW